MVNTCAGRTRQDASPDYFRLGFVSVCGTVTARHMVPRVVQDIFRTAPAEVLVKELPDIMKVLTKIADEALLRADLLENIPSIAAQAVESSGRVAALSDVVGDYLLPLVVRNLGCSDTGADKAAQAALIQLIERGFVSKFQAEIKICPSILALTKMEGQLDVNTGAVTLMSKLAPLLGKDITERIFLKRFTELCSSPMFYVRKLSASHLGHYCAVVGKDAFEKTLLPCYLALCQDEIWGVRKSCAEVIMFLSCTCPPDLRKSLLAPAFTKLLEDECRWVRMSAFQTLGAFISTFADPPLTSIGYNSSGSLVMFNQNGNNFHPGGTEGFMNPTTITAREEMPFFTLAEDYFENVNMTTGESIDNIDVLTGDGKKQTQQVSQDNETIGDSDKTTVADESKENEETDQNSAEHGDEQGSMQETVVESKENVISEKISVDESIPDTLNTGQPHPDLKEGKVKVEKNKEEIPDVRIPKTEPDKTHEDDLLSYNQYNYWYISPPEVDLEGLVEVRKAAPTSGLQAGPTSLDVMTSHLEDLYATISLNDSSDDGTNTSILPSRDNMGDNLVNKSSDVNNVNSVMTTIELKEPSQKIVPQELIDNFVSMAQCETSFGDVDIPFHCAYALPAVVLTLGKENWPLLKNTVHLLAGHMSYRIRRTVASSLHEIASILGPEAATENLSPLFEGFVKDLDEVRIGILKHLAHFLQLICPEKRVVFLPKLHGFYEGRATTTNLAIYQNFLISSVEAGKQVDSIYTDLSKAFDSVYHPLLLKKLSEIGISGHYLEWISSYLNNRRQRVTVCGSVSHEVLVTSGVPQGSHIGPILFLLFINDVISCFETSNFLLYADDIKFYDVVCPSLNGLQSDLDRFVKWCDLNCLNVNVSKCKAISFYKCHNPINVAYSIKNENLDKVNHFNDLGVLFDRDLNFNMHVDNIISKSLKMLGFLKRVTRHINDTKALTCLYNCLVRSVLEYCSVIWTPRYSCHIVRLERVQNKFVKYLLFKFHFPYQDVPYETRLLLCGFKSLEVRRNNALLLFLFKLINGLIDCGDLLGLISFLVPTRRTRRTQLFFERTHRTNYGQCAFIDRMVHNYNTLYSDLDIFNLRLSSLKRMLSSNIV